MSYTLHPIDRFGTRHGYHERKISTDDRRAIGLLAELGATQSPSGFWRMTPYKATRFEQLYKAGAMAHSPGFLVLGGEKIRTAESTQFARMLISDRASRPLYSDCA